MRSLESVNGELFNSSGWEERQFAAGLKLGADFAQTRVPGKKVRDANIEGARQEQEFAIRHPPALDFQAGQRISTDIPAAQLKFGGQRFLRQTPGRPPLSHLRANQVQCSLSHC
jgi:hypothetical protein